MHRHLFSIGPLDVNTYGLLVGLGILGALGVLWLFCKRTKVADPIYRFYSMLGIVSVAMGLVGAWLFQFIYYNIHAAVNNEDFSWNAGLTFMGGLVMGIVTFVVGTGIFAKPAVRSEFWKVASIGTASVAFALTLGRWGCFFAGCCFGTQGIGIYFPPDPRYNNQGNRNPDIQRLPTNLMEAVYSSILLVILVILTLRYKKSHLNIFIYGMAYSIWRFAIEFVRDDQRYQVGPLSPSQWQSLILFTVVAVLAFLMIKYNKLPFYKPELALENIGILAEAQENKTLKVETADYAAASSNESFYTEEDVKKVTRHELVSNNKEANLFRYIFYGGLVCAALFAIIGFILIGTSPATPVEGTRAGAWFMFLIAHIGLMVATCFMPLEGGFNGVFVKNEILLDEDVIEKHFRQGDSIWNKWRNKNNEDKEEEDAD